MTIVASLLSLIAAYGLLTSTGTMAFNFSIAVTSCDFLVYQLTGPLNESSTLPTEGQIRFGNYTQNFTVTPTRLSLDEGGETFLLNSTLTYDEQSFIKSSNNAKDGIVEVNVQLFIPSEMASAVVSASANGTCGLAASFPSPYEAPSTTQALGQTSTVAATSTESEVQTMIAAEAVSPALSSFQATDSTYIVLPQQTYTETPPEAGGRIDHEPVIKEGVTVGVLGLLLLFVGLSIGFLAQRRKRRRMVEREYALTAPFRAYDDKFDDVQEADRTFKSVPA